MIVVVPVRARILHVPPALMAAPMGLGCTRSYASPNSRHGTVPLTRYADGEARFATTSTTPFAAAAQQR